MGLLLCGRFFAAVRLRRARLRAVKRPGILPCMIAAKRTALVTFVLAATLLTGAPATTYVSSEIASSPISEFSPDRAEGIDPNSEDSSSVVIIVITTPQQVSSFAHRGEYYFRYRNYPPEHTSFMRPDSPRSKVRLRLTSTVTALERPWLKLWRT